MPHDDVLYYRKNIRHYNTPNLSNYERTKVSQLTNGLYHTHDPSEHELLTAVIHTPDTTIFNSALLKIYEKRDSEVLALIQPLAKICIGMRRLRLLNIAKTNKTVADEIIPYMSELNYELVTNILIWTIIHGTESFHTLRRYGYFNDVKTFNAQSRELGYTVKVFERCFALKTKYAEIGNLAGYRMVDDSFDIEEECKSLAHGPDYKSEIRNLLFGPMLQELMGSSRILPKTNITFEEYVKEGRWLTSGSSSIGRVHWTIDEKTRHFKARKNMLLDIYSPDELWELVSKWDGVIRNKPLIKNELAKMRLAVASNIESYLYEAYMMQVIGHEYTTWDYITLDESETEYCKRTEKLMEGLEYGAYALPWDFKSFDHQATTLEIQSILSNMFSKVVLTDEQIDISGKILHSYGKGIIYQDTTEPRFEYRIMGGLQSGQRITSLIGNIWNAVVTKSALWIAKHLCPDLHFGEVALRGDDTYVLADTALGAYYIRLAYASMFALGNDAKFSIRQISCEFLRSEISPKRVTAWLNRSIPAITQRKPWSDKPWDPVREIVTITDNIRTAERRFGKCEFTTLHLANKQQWSKYTRQSYLYLHLPARLGGIGVYDFNGWIPDCRLPPTKRPNIAVTSDLRGKMPEYLTGIVREEDYLKGSLTSKMQPGDVAGDFVGMTINYIQDVRKIKTKWVKKTEYLAISNQIADRLIKTLLRTAPLPPDYTFPRPRIKVDLTSTTRGWPSFPRFLSDFGKFQQYTTESLASLARQHYPNVWRQMRAYEKRGFHRTDAISMILGDFPAAVNMYTNARLTSIIKESIRDEVLRVHGRDQIAISMANYTAYVGYTLTTLPINIMFNF